MSPEDAVKLRIDAAFARGFKEAEHYGITLARKMRKAREKAGGGNVTLTLAANGTFYAHAYPTPKQANDAARERMAIGRAAPRPGGKLDTLMAVVREEQSKPIANASGRTLDAALDTLLKNFA
jgi:hypothetical protein